MYNRGATKPPGMISSNFLSCYIRLDFVKMSVHVVNCIGCELHTVAAVVSNL